MNAGMEPHPVSRMTLPSPGGAIGAVVVLVFVLFFSSLAAYHIVHFADTPTFGIVAAVFWLAFVTLIGREAVYSRGGVRGFIVACLGRFSSRHFVEALREGERTVISFGFELLRRKFYHLRIDCEQIVWIEMSAGQASSRSGKDMNDWSIFLWYRDRSLPRSSGVNFCTDEVYPIPRPQAKVTTGELFREFVAFLLAAGVERQLTGIESQCRTSDANSSPNFPSPPSPSA